jgi:hypothetical protein
MSYEPKECKRTQQININNPCISVNAAMFADILYQIISLNRLRSLTKEMVKPGNNSNKLLCSSIQLMSQLENCYKEPKVSVVAFVLLKGPAFANGSL